MLYYQNPKYYWYPIRYLYYSYLNIERKRGYSFVFVDRPAAYLDTDTVLVNTLDNIIKDSCGKFLISKHFWIPDVKSFKQKAETCSETFLYLSKLNLIDSMDFCAAGVFFFEKNDTNLCILNETFNLHEQIYNKQDYIIGIYDEQILNSVLLRKILMTFTFFGITLQLKAFTHFRKKQMSVKINLSYFVYEHISHRICILL